MDLKKKSCKEQEKSLSPEVNQNSDEGFWGAIGINLPPEVIQDKVWKTIFELTKTEEPKSLSKLRLVCKKWRDVIDENFDLKIKINDDLMDTSSIQRFRKVSHCIVSKFVRENPQQQLFKDPKLLTNLRILGPVSHYNFSLIVDQCHSITEFIFTERLIGAEANMFTAAKIDQFAHSLKKLVFTGLWIDFGPGTVTADNLFRLLKYPMPNLTSLTIRASYSKEFDEQHFHFVSFVWRCTALNFLNVTIRNLGRVDQSALQATPLSTFPTLVTVKIECSRNVLFKNWMPLLMHQTLMKCLHLLVTDDELDVDWQIEEIFAKNQLSLEFLEIGEIRSLINCQIFQGLVNLKTLKLSGNYKQPAIVDNLRALPKSVTTLELVHSR